MKYGMWRNPRILNLTATFAIALFFVGSPAQAAINVFWTDWTSGDFSSGFTGQGTITTSSSTVNVTYNNPQGILFFQTSGGTDYFQNGPGNGGRNAATSPYTSDVHVANIPTAGEMIALQFAGNQTLTFSEAIANPVFSYVSLNGNGYAFNRDFEILSFGDGTVNSPGFWGAGTSFKNIVDLGGGNFEYQLLGTGEPHGTIRFTGAFSTVSWRSLSNEVWNGFTVGVQGTAVEVFVPEPASCLAWLGLGGLGFAASARRKFWKR
jgi:hypothetical protein